MLCYNLCLFVCLSVCTLDYSRSYEQILMKFFGGVGHGVRITVHIQVFWIKGFLLNYCDSYRHTRMKHENPQRRFELCECFLVQ